MLFIRLLFKFRYFVAINWTTNKKNDCAPWTQKKKENTIYREKWGVRDALDGILLFIAHKKGSNWNKLTRESGKFWHFWKNYFANYFAAAKLKAFLINVMEFKVVDWWIANYLNFDEFFVNILKYWGSRCWCEGSKNPNLNFLNFFLDLF